MVNENDIHLINSRNEFMNHNNIKVVSVTDNYAQVELEINSKSLNPYGIVHGGAYYTMADCAAGMLARTDGRKYLTLNSSINYIKSVSSGKIKAVSNIEHRGSSTCVVSVKITNENEDLLAKATFTMFCVGKNLF